MSTAIWKATPGTFDERPRPTYGPSIRRRFPSARSRLEGAAAGRPPAVLGALYRHRTDDFVERFEQLAGADCRRPPDLTDGPAGEAGRGRRRLQDIDDFAESVNATFALFDAMLKQVGAERKSALTLKSSAGGRSVKKVFVAG